MSIHPSYWKLKHKNILDEDGHVIWDAVKERQESHEGNPSEIGPVDYLYVYAAAKIRFGSLGVESFPDWALPHLEEQGDQQTRCDEDLGQIMHPRNVGEIARNEM